MKKLTLLLLLLFSLKGFSQDVIFCESVSKDGKPVNPGAHFVTGQDGGYFTVLVKLKNPTPSTKIIYDLYRLNEKGGEHFENSIKTEISPGLTWFFKAITFYRAGNYHLYVYDDRDRLLGVGKVSVETR